jgi:predicted lipoprotein with Yx(FWY)xxD motif
MIRKLAALVACAMLLVVAAGCGSDNNSSPYGDSADADAGATPAAAAASNGAVTIATKKTDIGTVLSGADGRTVYLFEADKNGKSACSGDCAAAWPPVTGKVTASGDADSGQLGTVSGGDQVTYAGHPLYYYVKDTDEADTYGQEVDAFGAEWYAMTASGQKVEDSGESEDDSSKSSGY